jgi:hypothetical protein
MWNRRVLKAFDALLCGVAHAAFDTIQFFNQYRPNPSITPKRSDRPLLKSWEKSRPGQPCQMQTQPRLCQVFPGAHG